jgi:transposase-like protein
MRAGGDQDDSQDPPFMEDRTMRGRKPSGPEYVERLQGSAKAKERARVVLETLAGRLSVQDACRRLGIGEAFFNRLRLRFLSGGVPALEDRPAGRRPRPVSAEEEQLRRLEAELQEARLDLQAAQLREEIALAMPHLLPVSSALAWGHIRGVARAGARREDRGTAGSDMVQGGHAAH